MSNPGQPTIALGATRAPVRRLQRALLRTLDLGLRLTHIWTAGRGRSKELPAGSRPGGQRTVDAVTWNALPDGGPMATLEQGSSGDVVRPLQTLLTNGAAG
jgi:hypothetical protein